MKQHRAALVVIVAALALAGCSAAGSTGTDSSDSAGDLPGVVAPEAMPGEAPTESASGEEAGSSADRQVISEGTVTITAVDPIAAAGDAVAIVEASGGRIDSRTERPAVDEEDRLASADLVVRIPSAKLTATLDAVKELGEVEQAQLNQTDVTAQTQDVDARITALTTSTGRLTALLAAATTTEDLIEIESTLSQRQGELEALQTQQRGYADQVQLATVSLAFGSEATAPVDSPDTFLSGLATGWQSLIGFVGALLVALGVALPWLVVLALAAAAALVVIRRRRPGTPATATMEE